MVRGFASDPGELAATRGMTGAPEAFSPSAAGRATRLATNGHPDGER